MTVPLKAIANSALSIFGIRTEEQPAYEDIDKLGDVEIRRYGPRGAIETAVTSTNDATARSEAFNILASYIFGNNRDRRTVAMTAPVTTKRDLPMTAPVQTSGHPGRMTMRFFLPKDVPVAEAPEPLDARVHLIEVPAETLAVLPFTGSWSTDAFSQRASALLRRLDGARYHADGDPVVLLYDPPFAIPFLRRNEVAVRVVQGSAHSTVADTETEIRSVRP